ncbi:FAD-binding protein [Legionella brunensis]|uniref:Cytokinin oxidase n=1 Tax=Legionella brunensis TaxID=29422 RepID=A0A0W0S598_9GAMM|nr:FAD-binding protein [Legionella brunensis]KTC78205.1 cytokinin oxidase [Legionella brunensis]
MSRFRKFVDSLPELGRFTSIPAAMIDRAYLKKSGGVFSRAWRFFQIRLTYLGLFLPLAIVDLFVAGALGVRYAFGAFFTTDSLQDKRLEQQKKYATIFSKNLYALMAFVFGLFSPKLIAFYFTPEKISENGVTAGGSYHRDENAELKTPDTEEDLKGILFEAASKGQKVMPVGAGRSQGKQFLPEGGNGSIVIDMSNFNTIQIDAKEKTANVGAGVRWIDLQKQADEHKLALRVMQASNVFSVGGSIGTNIHGWDHIDGVLSNTILSIDIMTPKGELKTLTPEDPLFHQVTGGLGLFGVIVSAKIRLTDNELLKEKGSDIPVADYAKHFRDNVQSNANIRMHLYRLSLDPNNLLGSGVAVDYVKEGDSEPCKTENLDAEGPGGTRFNRVMVNVARRFSWVRKKYWEGERDRLLANDSLPMTTNEIMQPPINALFNPSVSEAEWLQEFFLPEEKLPAFLDNLGKLLMKNDVVLLNASVRFVKKHDKSPLSYAHDGDRFAVVLCFNQSLEPTEIIKARKWLREAQHMSIEHGGTYYLPYQHVSSPEDFEAAYPLAKEAQLAKDEVDPDGLFTSGFHQKYLSQKPKKINHFKEIMKSKETKKKFAGFLENVLQRVDTNKFYQLLEDVMKYNDSHEEIYTELCNRLPEVMPSALGGFRRILNSLASIKEDLGAQAKALMPDTTEINGLVEIGYPGRFVDGFKKNFKVTGKIAAVYEAPSITDYVQTGFPRPYDQFAKLDYSKPNLKELADNSADVITCYVGLHHFPEEELDNFLEEVRRVLRDGGRFLLVDHDVVDNESMSMAHMAHMIFNAVNGVSVKEEMEETRNFRSMDYWISKLEEHGLGYGVKGADVPMIRAGDPSRNRMVSFVKAAPQQKLEVKESVNNEKFEPEKGLSHSSSLIEKAQAGAWRENKAIHRSVSHDSFFAEETSVVSEHHNLSPSEEAPSLM